MKRNIAVILAGGVGERLGMSTPKQFFKVAGKMVVGTLSTSLNVIRALTRLPSCLIRCSSATSRILSCETSGAR